MEEIEFTYKVVEERNVLDHPYQPCVVLTLEVTASTSRVEGKAQFQLVLNELQYRSWQDGRRKAMEGME